RLGRPAALRQPRGPRRFRRARPRQPPVPHEPRRRRTPPHRTAAAGRGGVRRQLEGFLSMRTARGFALIEVLITLAVILVGLTGALRLQAGLLSASAAAKARDEAQALATARLARLRDQFSEADYHDGLVPGREEIPGQLHRYRLEWRI